MVKVTPTLRAMITIRLTSFEKIPNLFPPPSHFPEKITKPPNQFSQKPPAKIPDLDISKKFEITQQKKTLFKSPEPNEAKKLFTSLISSTQVPPDPIFLNSFFESYTAISTVDDSISLLRHMIESLPSFTPDLSTYHIILSKSCKLPDRTLSQVLQVLDLMKGNGFNPNQVTVDVAVRSLCSAGGEGVAVKLVKELSSKYLTPDVSTYNYLIQCLCKSRALSSVFAFVVEMQSEFDVKANHDTYAILVDSVCNAKSLCEGMRLLRMYRNCGVEPDCFLYNAIMKGFCKLGKNGEVVEVFKNMKEDGVEPDLLTYNSLIIGLSKCGRVRDALMYLQVMVESGCVPNVVMYTALMDGLCREGDALGALALLEEMEKKGCSPDSCTYNLLLLYMCKEGLLDKGIELYNAMKEAGMQLERASYGTFVRALCGEGKVDEAYEVFDYAVESKSLTDASAYMTLESALKSLTKTTEKVLAV
ncbi:pentatricopeptide repeat-containing protein At2g17670-like [Mercurialis annua]|uniref:pentatricopeptide repeat-containing protein At2g17670-like n=1 Tax=Mercurialis annua TaxID=3986 RepID=UPI00215FF246|nr:pentatricopeptide repeat-containing protein At2g17670-like [Mercurialis annua]XP_050229008.1 pentatricopeptide repeat-containing protein At2g17670-like [Mercurialis annua]